MLFHKDKSFGVVKYKFLGLTIFKKGNSQKGAYGMHSILEEFSGIKLNRKKIKIQHGWSPLDGAFPQDLLKQKHAKAVFAWNKRYCDDWNKKSSIPCYILGSLFVYYRKMKNIKQDINAKGTIAYPAHSTATGKAKFNIDEYCSQLKSLPEEFHPIVVSLHPLDIELYHMDKEYEKRGFKTVCAGSDTTKPFYEVFYDNLRKYKYTTSNEPGSYTFYSVEMGIPFFILGPQASYENTSDVSDNSCQKEKKIINYKYGKLAYDLFSQSPKGVITDEQKAFVNSELGINDCISREELIKILRDVK